MTIVQRQPTTRHNKKVREHQSERANEKEQNKKYDENIIRNSAEAATAAAVAAVAYEIIHMAKQQVHAAHTFTHFSMTIDSTIETICLCMHVYIQRPHVLQ